MSYMGKPIKDKTNQRKARATDGNADAKSKKGRGYKQQEIKSRIERVKCKKLVQQNKRRYGSPQLALCPARLEATVLIGHHFKGTVYTRMCTFPTASRHTASVEQKPPNASNNKESSGQSVSEDSVSVFLDNQ